MRCLDKVGMKEGEVKRMLRDGSIREVREIERARGNARERKYK